MAGTVAQFFEVEHPDHLLAATGLLDERGKGCMRRFELYRAAGMLSTRHARFGWVVIVKHRHARQTAQAPEETRHYFAGGGVLVLVEPDKLFDGVNDE